MCVNKYKKWWSIAKPQLGTHLFALVHQPETLTRLWDVIAEGAVIRRRLMHGQRQDQTHQQHHPCPRHLDLLTLERGEGNWSAPPRTAANKMWWGINRERLFGRTLVIAIRLQHPPFGVRGDKWSYCPRGQVLSSMHYFWICTLDSSVNLNHHIILNTS